MAQDRGQCRITGGPDLRRCPRLRSWTAGSAQVSGDLGRAEGTLAAIQEATGIYWELAAARPDRFRADLSGAASGRPLTINLVSRRRHRHILLATSSRPNRSVSAAHVPFQATSRRNLGLEDAVPPRTVTVWESIGSRQGRPRPPPVNGLAGQTCKHERRRPARPRASGKHDVRPVQAGLSALGAVTGPMQREYRLRGDRGSWTERGAGETRGREEKLRGRGQLRG